ncbi:AGE family epimerase/isomerase [Rubricoccus marinus]|uniref:SGNH hydrolase-type esterase domain-containing protein n=1 Tax=Rubricoccus marinus TaxID=716817 RepID=A0A259TU81_9BACT|nr:AGE family epimerase/isomerase [Rubricoccus marinus]OZC01332.1 hypothetical protein BSZ36_17980 [Rubricoccus marinus]
MIRPLALAALALLAVPGRGQTAGTALAPDVRAALAEEMTFSLQSEVLDAWYPRAVDREAGGFLSRFDYAWNPVGDQQKMIVTQSRHVWTTAQAAMWTDDEAYREMALHGVAFLRDEMWDAENGGFYWLVQRDGTPIPEADGRLVKQAYGNAFAIYGLAAAHAATGHPEPLAMAQEAFRWLDAHAHDAEHGGYFNYLTREGEPLRQGLGRTPPKDQNSSIHILEAFTELYHVWPDATLRQRIDEMLTLIRDTITVEPGTLTLFSLADWTPVSYRDSTEDVREANRYYDHVSFGHDVETAFLMLEAAEAIGLDSGPTLLAGKKMVDHSLRTGWDAANAGFVEAGYYFADGEPLSVTDPTKNWWAQAEGLNTLLLMGDHFPDDPMRYHDRFLQIWGTIQAYLVDHEHGGWYMGTLDRQPGLRRADKGGIWKGPYHNARALMNVARRLQSVPAADPRVQIMGRHLAHPDGSVSFAASGVTFVVRFRGTRLAAHIEDEFRYGTEHNWFTVVVDGGEPVRFQTRPGQRETVLAEGLASGEHTLWLSKATEGQNGHNRLVSFSGAELLPAEPLPARRIEFIGDSITSGFGADSEPIACGAGTWYDATHAWIAYGPRLARRLDAQWMLSSVSGMGLHRNWNTLAPVMPDVYDGVYMEYATDNPPWDSTLYRPDLVVVALGTNDFSAGDGETTREALDGAAFVADYARFLARLRERYPDAPVLLLNSPVFEGAQKAQLAGYLREVAARRAASGDPAVSVFTYDGRYVAGCDGHPGGAEHVRMADELEPVVREITGW